ncbi:hypothetical protein QUF70_06620 [Desulfobacterales bacterium HSG17]|nr:hypothetical protein [Desulfobacterales bacterium HSG17]
MMNKTVDRDNFLNELNERVIGLTIAQSIILSVLAELSDDLPIAVEKRVEQAVKTIPKEMQTPVVMEQIDYLLKCIGKVAQPDNNTGFPPYLKIIPGGKLKGKPDNK